MMELLFEQKRFDGWWVMYYYDVNVNEMQRIRNDWPYHLMPMTGRKEFGKWCEMRYQNGTTKLHKIMG